MIEVYKNGTDECLSPTCNNCGKLDCLNGRFLMNHCPEYLESQDEEK